MKLNLLMYASTMMLFSQVKAQYFAFDSLDINNLSIVIESNGDMHKDTSNSITSHMPIGSNSKAIDRQCLWMGGYDENSELRLAANMYRQAGNDYWPGPVGNNYDTVFDNLYNKVWHLKKSDIENHIIQYNTTGYTIPDDIVNWPVNGNIANGEAQNLAPYHDLNSNDIYEPELGDYPLIRGDEALYVIYNDDRNIHTQSGGQKIKAEIHHMLYAYYSNEEEYNNNTVYSHYEIYNRSTLNFQNFYVSNFLDLDVGYYIDDYVGTEVSKNLIYGYNSTNYDLVNNGSLYSNGYGFNPPTIGHVSLNQDLVHSTCFINTQSPHDGNPSDYDHYYNYMLGKWKQGNPIIHPIDSVISDYRYTDFPDTLDNTNWSAISSIYANPNDYRALSTIYALNFGPGDKICMDNAIIFAHDTSLTHLEQITHLFNLTDQVQNFYDNKYDNCADVSDLSLHEHISLVGQNLNIKQELNTISLELEEVLNQDLHIKLIDALGRTVVQNTLRRGDISIQIELQKATPGTYFILCSNQSLNKSIKIIMP